MSDTSQGPGWWQASDGKFYPPETHPVTGSQGSGAVTPPAQPAAPTPMTPDVDGPTVAGGTPSAFPGPGPVDGTVNTPDVNAPSINTPDVNAPGFGAPNVNAPDVNPPNIGAPDVNMPDVNAPDIGVPDVNAPNVSAPGMGAAAAGAAGVGAAAGAAIPGTPPQGSYQAAPAAGTPGYQAAPSNYQTVEPPKKKGGMLKKILIGLLILGVLLIGGCVALIALVGTNEGLQNRLTGMVFSTPVTQCGADADGNLEAVGTISTPEGADIETSDEIPIRVKFMDGDEVIAEGTTNVANVSSTPTEFIVETPGTAPAGMTCTANVSLG